MSRIDSGKLAKTSGALRPRDGRKVDQDPMRLPPHKKPRAYTLTVEWTETQTIQQTAKFISKDARDQARIRFARELGSKRYLSSSWWYQNSKEKRSFHVKTGPTFTETMEEG